MKFKELQAGKFFSFKTNNESYQETAPVCIKTKDGGYTILTGSYVGAHIVFSYKPIHNKEIICLDEFEVSR